MSGRYSPGEVVPESGVYRLNALRGSEPWRKITLIRGRRFPSDPECGEVHFDLIFSDETCWRRRDRRHKSTGSQSRRSGATALSKTAPVSSIAVVVQCISDFMAVLAWHSRFGPALRNPIAEPEPVK